MFEGSSLLTRSALGAAIFILCAAVSAQAGLNPTQLETRCHAAKLKAAGKACLCRYKSELKALKKGGDADNAKCVAKLGQHFSKAQTKGAGWCRTSEDQGTVEGRLEAAVSATSAAVTGPADAGKPALKCSMKKLKAAGKLCLCRNKTRSKAVQKNRLPDHTKCQGKFAQAFAKAEAKGGCHSENDSGVVADLVTDQCGEVEADLADLGTAEYSARGRYSVGLRSYTVVETTRPTNASGSLPASPEREFPLYVWYPADAPSYAEHTMNAAVTQEGAPFPLVIRAHGFGGFNADSTSLSGHVASHGYIVVAPTFPLTNFYMDAADRDLLDVGEQALDVAFLIDTVLAWNEEPGNAFYGKVDASRIACNGHSLGGATCLLAGFHPTHGDARIGAIAPLAPLACVFTDIFFDAPELPMMIVAGTDDLITPYPSNGFGPFQMAEQPKYLVTIDGGTHLGFANELSFTNPDDHPDDTVFCSGLFPDLSERPGDFTLEIPEDYLGGAAAGMDHTASTCEPICPLPGDGFIAHSRQQVLTKAAVVAFFDSVLHGSPSAERLLEGRLETENAEITID